MQEQVHSCKHMFFFCVCVLNAAPYGVKGEVVKEKEPGTFYSQTLDSTLFTPAAVCLRMACF